MISEGTTVEQQARQGLAAGEAQPLQQPRPCPLSTAFRVAAVPACLLLPRQQPRRELALVKHSNSRAPRQLLLMVAQLYCQLQGSRHPSSRWLG